jgi:hypothetical protein
VSGAVARDFQVTSALHFLTRRAGASLSGQRPPDMNLPTNGHRVARRPRRRFMMSRWIRGSGWHPNFRSPALPQYTLEPVHEGYEVLGSKPVGTLRNAIWQFPFRNLEEVLRKANRYSLLGVPKPAHKRVTMVSALGPALWSLCTVLQLHFLGRRLDRACGQARRRSAKLLRDSALRKERGQYCKPLFPSRFTSVWCRLSVPRLARRGWASSSWPTSVPIPMSIARPVPRS